jgi:predicted transcriptional regulator
MTWDYVCGFFDGEGSAGVYGKSFRLAFHNTHRGSLDAMREFICCGKVRERKNVKGFGKKRMFVLAVERVDDLRAIIPHMIDRCIIKRDALIALLAHVKDKQSRWQNRGKLAACGIEQVRSWHWIDGLSVHKIARYVGVTSVAVYRFMVKNNIAVKPHDKHSQKLLSGVGPEELRKMHWDHNMPPKAIANRLKISRSAVQRYMLKNGIPLRNRQEAGLIRRK